MALIGEMQYLTIGGNTYSLPVGGGGTVTSVAVSNATNGGLSVSGSPISSSGTITIGHSNVLAAAQTTQAVYPITIDKNGHISGYGTAVTIPDISGKIDTAGTGLSKSGTTLNHSNSVTAQTTQAVYPIKIDAQGHISAYGSAVTIPTVPSNIVNTITTTAGTHTAISSSTGAVSFNVPTKTSHLTNDSGFITASHTSTYSLPLAADGTRGGVQIGYSESGTNYAVKLSSEKMYVTVPWTDTKVTTAALKSGTTYYPILATGTGTATRQIDSTLSGLKYVSTAGTTSAVGTAILCLGNTTGSGTANNEQGVLRLYSSNATYYTDLKSSSASSIKTITFPNATGTVALTSDISSTSTPTADRIAEFDSTAHMNSTDMTSQEVDDFVDSLNISGTNILNMFYPVGSYYETSDSTFDPNVQWGGTWVLETAGQVHVSSGTGYTINGALTNTTDGGASTVSLQTTNLPAHTHALFGSDYPGNSDPSSSSIINRYATSGYTDLPYSIRPTQTVTTATVGKSGSTGSGQAHNNMPPYIVVNRWHRIA